VVSDFPSEEEHIASVLNDPHTKGLIKQQEDRWNKPFAQSEGGKFLDGIQGLTNRPLDRPTSMQAELASMRPEERERAEEELQEYNTEIREQEIAHFENMSEQDVLKFQHQLKE
jgi:hypothetical protein